MKSNESNQGDANKIATQSDTIIPVGTVSIFPQHRKQLPSYSKYFI